jgi:hypothetical protein
VSVIFRGLPACTCQAAWIPFYERELQRRGIIDGPLSIAQLIGGFSGSGGTHTTGGACDFWLTGSRADQAVWVARQMGADPTWHRLRGWDNGGGSEHIHAVLRGCPHLSLSARSQVISVDANGDGLSGTSTPDPGPRPLSGRTWQQGIEWQRQEEDDMADPATQQKLDDILTAAREAVQQIGQLRSAETDRAVSDRKRDEEIAAQLDALAIQINTRAGKEQVRRIKELLTQHDPEETA